MSSHPGWQRAGSRAARENSQVRLGGTGRLADDLYLLAHHEITGKPHLQPRALGLGLAGALLAELVLPGTIRVWPDAVVVAGRTAPGDDLARVVAGRVASEREHVPVRDWLLFLARTATGDVARRLEQSGYLTRTTARRPWRGERWVPVDADCAFAPLVRVKAALSAAGLGTTDGAVLAGLAAACGLGPQLALYLPPKCRLEEAARQLDPGLRQLIIQTQAAVDSAVLSHRA